MVVDGARPPCRSPRLRGARRRRGAPALRFARRASGATRGAATSATEPRSSRRSSSSCIVLYCLIIPGFWKIPGLWTTLFDIDPNEVELLARRTLAPSLEHPFGTDKFGRDLFTRAAIGGQISIAIALRGDVRHPPDRRRVRRRSPASSAGELDNAHDALPRRALRSAVPALRDHHARRSSARGRSTSGRW